MKSFFCSWSGGKDCCFSLYKAMQQGGKPSFLFTMCTESGGRTRSHGLSTAIVLAQAKALGIPIAFQNSSWNEYRKNFIKGVKNGIKQSGVSGLEFGVFGDMDIEANRLWEEEVSKDIGVKSWLPLWGINRKAMIEGFLGAGFVAQIVSVDSKRLNKEYLGMNLSLKLIEEFKQKDIDICGENGEYHSVVVDGPIFSKRLMIEQGDSLLRSDYWFQDFKLLD